LVTDDWNDDERRVEEFEPVAPCGGNALSLRDKALSVSEAYLACRAGVPEGFGHRDAGVWVLWFESGVTAAWLYLSPLHGCFDAA